MELVGVESGHDDTGGTADQDHGRPERGAEPAEGTMPAHVVRTHEGGLQDKEYEPAGKDGGMKIQNDGARNGGMEQVSVDGEAEAPYNNGGDEQRHGEIEILVQQTVSAKYGIERTRNGALRESGHCWNLDLALFGGTSRGGTSASFLPI